MTQREFFQNVVSAEISDEMTAFAEAQIKKLDDKNATRRNSLTKTQKGNEELKTIILNTMEKDKIYTAKEIASFLTTEENEVTTQKANAILGQLVKTGHLTSEKIKARNGKVLGYSLIEAEIIETN